MPESKEKSTTKRIDLLLTRPELESERLANLLDKKKFRIKISPLIEINSIDYKFEDTVQYDLIIFTSKNGINNFQYLKKDDKVLVIGCLTGYSVAILSNLVGYVFAIENDKKLVELANQTLTEMSLLNCSVHYKSKLSTGNSHNQPFDKIFIEGCVNHMPQGLVKQLKEDGEIYTVIKNIDDPIGFFVRGLKIKNDVSFTKIFNTNVCNLNDFTEVGDDYAQNN